MRSPGAACHPPTRLTCWLAVYRWVRCASCSDGTALGAMRWSLLAVGGRTEPVTGHAKECTCCWRSQPCSLSPCSHLVCSPPNAYADGRAPIKFANASDAPGHLASGGGSLTLRLVNMRADVRVVLVRGGPDQPTVAARGPVIRCAHQARHSAHVRGGHLLHPPSPLRSAPVHSLRWAPQTQTHHSPCRAGTATPTSPPAST